MSNTTNPEPINELDARPAGVMAIHELSGVGYSLGIGCTLGRATRWLVWLGGCPVGSELERGHGSCYEFATQAEALGWAANYVLSDAAAEMGETHTPLAVVR